MEGDRRGFPTKNEIVFYLKKYVQKYDLPIKLDTQVINVSKKNDYYQVVTNKEKFSTKSCHCYGTFSNT